VASFHEDGSHRVSSSLLLTVVGDLVLISTKIIFVLLLQWEASVWVVTLVQEARQSLTRFKHSIESLLY